MIQIICCLVELVITKSTKLASQLGFGGNCYLDYFHFVFH